MLRPPSEYLVLAEHTLLPPVRPLRKAVLMSSWCSCMSCAATTDSKARRVLYLLTGANTSSKSMPSRWFEPLGNKACFETLNIANSIRFHLVHPLNWDGSDTGGLLHKGPCVVGMKRCHLLIHCCCQFCVRRLQSCLQGGGLRSGVGQQSGVGCCRLHGSALNNHSCH